MRKVLTIIAVILLLFGVYETSQTFSYLARASTVAATVLSVETRTGPPKPSQNTPVHVQFALQSGQQHSAITHLPLLHRVKEGDTIHLLVDSSNPQDVRLPLISELWARPLAYLVSGMVMICGLLFLAPRFREGIAKLGAAS